MTDLQELLRRAIEAEAALEAKSEPVVEAEAEAEVKAEDLAARVADLEATVLFLASAAASSEVKAAGVCPSCGSKDFDEFEDGSASCVDCGAEVMSAAAAGAPGKGEDEGKDLGVDFDGADGFDFDDADLGVLDEKAWDDLDDAVAAAEVETKSGEVGESMVTLSEGELLLARRFALEA